jgi:hypothetical protein
MEELEFVVVPIVKKKVNNKPKLYNLISFKATKEKKRKENKPVEHQNHAQHLYASGFFLLQKSCCFILRGSSIVFVKRAQSGYIPLVR